MVRLLKNIIVCSGFHVCTPLCCVQGNILCDKSPRPDDLKISTIRATNQTALVILKSLSFP